MCRMLGYLGPPLRLSELIEAPPHSLERQSYAAKELRGAVVSADGWGAGFYVPDDHTPCVYRSTLPIWADSNRSQLGRAIRLECGVACVRSATEPLSVSIANTPPFNMGSLLLVHNGYIENFSATLARRLEALLSDDRYRQISGRTDSEYVLALIADYYVRSEQAPPRERLYSAVQHAVLRLLELTREAGITGLFSLVVTDGTCLVGTRAGHGDAPPSLYLRPADRARSAGALVASEPLDEDSAWQAIAPGQAVLVTRDSVPERRQLDATCAMNF